MTGGETAGGVVDPEDVDNATFRLHMEEEPNKRALQCFHDEEHDAIATKNNPTQFAQRLCEAELTRTHDAWCHMLC